MKIHVAAKPAFCAVALALLAASCSRDGVGFRREEPDASSAMIGAFPDARLETSLGAFVLPDSALANLKEEELVPPEGSMARRICEKLGHRPHLKMTALDDEELEKTFEFARRDFPRALAILWTEYAVKREALLSKLSATGFLTMGDVDVILDLNSTDLLLRIVDGNYGVRVAGVIAETDSSVRRSKGMILETRLGELHERRKTALLEIGMSKIRESFEANRAMMSWAIGGLNQIRENSRRRRENFWNYREQKLKTQTATQYQGVSSTCACCGGLVTAGGECPASRDGRHHVSSFPGPKMTNSSDEGLRAW